MIYALIFFLNMAGFASLLLAMGKHQQDWLGHKLVKARADMLRRAGFIAIGLAFVVSGSGLGWGYGTVAWFGFLTLTALLMVTANVNRSTILRVVRKGAR